MGRAMRNSVSGICRQRRSGSASASAQLDQGLFCPLTESFYTIECRNGEKRPGSDLAHAQDDVNPHILRMVEALQKHAYSNILEILKRKKEKFQIKNSDIFHSSAQNVDCVYSLEPPRRGGSNEYPQSMFLSR